MPINKACMCCCPKPNFHLATLLTNPTLKVNVNRGTAYVLYATTASAEEAVAHFHEGQLDSAPINVSIILPRRRFSRTPPRPVHEYRPPRERDRAGPGPGLSYDRPRDRPGPPPRGPPPRDLPPSRGGYRERSYSPPRRRSPPRGYGGGGGGGGGGFGRPRGGDVYYPGSSGGGMRGYNRSRSPPRRRTRSPYSSSRSPSRRRGSYRRRSDSYSRSRSPRRR